MASRRARTEGSARVRPSLRGPPSINTDFWTQGNGHETTAHSPSKTETKLQPSNKCCLDKYTPHTQSVQIWEKIILTTGFSNSALIALGPVKVIPRSLGREKGGGKGWQSSTFLVLALTRWHLNQLSYWSPTLGFFWIMFYKMMWDSMILSPQQ